MYIYNTGFFKSLFGIYHHIFINIPVAIPTLLKIVDDFIFIITNIIFFSLFSQYILII